MTIDTKFEYWLICYYPILIGFYDKLVRIHIATLAHDDPNTFLDVCWYSYCMSSGKIESELEMNIEQNEISFQERFNKSYHDVFTGN